MLIVEEAEDQMRAVEEPSLQILQAGVEAQVETIRGEIHEGLLLVVHAFFFLFLFVMVKLARERNAIPAVLELDARPEEAPRSHPPEAAAGVREPRLRVLDRTD